MKLRLLRSILILLSISGLSGSVCGQSQAPAIDWKLSFGGSGSDQAYAMKQTQDGGFIVTGFSTSNDKDLVVHHGPTTRRDMMVLRLDSKGKLLWQRSLGGSSEEISPCLCFSHDGGFIIAGGASSTDGDVTDHHGAAGTSDAWLVKLDSLGNTIWTKSYGGSLDDGISRIIPTDDADYIFAARSNSSDGDVSLHHGSANNSDIWVVKIDSVGKIEWQKTYGGSGTDAPFGLARTDDNAYVLAGYSNSNDGDVSGNHGGYDIWVCKINDTGKVIWENSFGSAGNEDMNSVTLATDGGYIVGGSAYTSGGDITTPHHGHSDSYDIWIFKLSRDGKIVWDRSFGGTGADYEQDVCATPDGGCLVSGYSTSNDIDVSGHHGDTTSQNYDCWIVKLDASGRLQWEGSYGGTQIDGATGIALTNDGGAAFACNSRSSDGDIGINKGNLDAWIFKLKPFGAGTQTVPIAGGSSPPEMFYPNPASSSTHLHLASSDWTLASVLELCDELGRQRLRIPLTADPAIADIPIDVSRLESGSYLARMIGADGIGTSCGTLRIER